ncbi:MAG: nitroreductase family protein [Acidimicrobiia bacterium]|nr:nitroreductase family protein [Acidimicrobiia bacterium]MDH3396565.1 nitroreductase family protein [Acidimicrobiia bacterium]
MEFQDVIRKRRMVRNYTDDPVDSTTIDRLIEATRRAPSAGFSQGQYLVVVTSAEGRQGIAYLSGEAEYVAAGFAPWISKAPVHFVICTSEADYHRRYREPDKVDRHGREITWPVPYWWVDAGASMMLLLLAAVDEGLAAGLLGVHSIPGLQALLGIPGDVTPIGVVTVGHAAPDRKSGSLQRGWKPQGDVVHRERWNGDEVGPS